ncbi:MAG: Ni/Fe hydrogenase subunit alpha [Acidimicrobiales bacterium]
MTGDRGTSRIVGVEGLSRVEGEGSLRVVVQDGTVTDVALQIFEPPRYFEALLVGRHFTEAPDITARICGICPVAYQMSACAAMEDACGVTVDDRVARLRRLLYCGEWIQSHALHIHLLHAPDFLDCADAVELARRDRGAVERGLGIKRTGNLVMETVGGRAIHPVNVRVGGFFRAPDPDAVRDLADPLRRARDAAVATVAWVSGFDFPDVVGDYRFVALRDAGRYPIERGRPTSSDGLDTSPAAFGQLAVEEHVARSTALHARLGGRDPYLTGPLARYALNSATLPPLAAGAAAEAGLGPVCANPFRSIVVRAVELVFACDEALSLVESYDPPDPPAADVQPRRGAGTSVGWGVTEAPRGLLLHRYEVDEDGTIVAARIMPPTSQNQLTIEADLRRVVQGGLDLDDDDLQWRCEQAVRNHDPCISCAAHFLEVTVVRA